MNPSFRISFTTSIIAAFCLLACEEAPFRTTLPDIPEILNTIPEEYAGTFMGANDSLLQEILKSDLSTEDYIVSGLENDSTWHFIHPMYSIHRLKDNKRIAFISLVTIPESRIDSGWYQNDTERISWIRILDNLIRVTSKTKDQKDTSVLMPVWRSGKLYHGVGPLRPGEETAADMFGYEIVKTLPATDQTNPENIFIPALLKEHDGSHYLMTNIDESLFEIEQFHLTEWGFMRRTIWDISLIPNPTQAEQTEFLEKLEALRKLTPADTLGNSIVLNPAREHLDPLFSSEFAQTSNYIRIKPAATWPESAPLTVFLGIALLAMTLAFLLKGRRKSES